MFSLEKEPPITGNKTRVEILASILKVAQKETLKTHIMYQANLSHMQLEKYLGFLTRNDLIARFTDEEYSTTFYKVTGKGIGFLKDYENLSQAYGSGILRSSK